MRYVSIEMVTPGSILVKDIVDDKGNILLKANSGVPLRDTIISRLKEKGIKGLYIVDEISKDLNIEEAIPVTVRNLAIKALEKKDVQETQQIASEIVGTFRSNVEIDLNRMINGVSYYERALNICELSLSLGKKLNMTNDTLKSLVSSALLSDIALIMDNKEKEQIIENGLANLKAILLNLPISETYPILSRFVVSQAHADPMVVHSVYFHKENEDGTGIVQDLFRKLGINHSWDIRDSAKIIHICSDYIDTLIKENDFAKARNMIEQGIINKKYNHNIASVFLNYIPIYPIGTIVNLSNGLRAIVMKNNDGFPLTPIIRLETGETVDLTKTLNVVIEGIEGIKKEESKDGLKH